MRHGKYETRKRRIPFATWILIILAVLGISFGGAVASLSTSVGPVENSFSAAQNITPTINSDYSVNIGEPGYAVFVRAMFTVNWKNADGHVLASAPVAGTDYTVTMNETNWEKNGAFWYYKGSISSGNTERLMDFTTITTNDGYALTVDMVVQTIQAVGTTDTTNIDAIKEAWSVNPPGTTGASE